MEGVFTLKLDEGVSLAMLVSFAQDMFPGVSTEDIGVWPADALASSWSRYAAAEQLRRIERRRLWKNQFAATWRVWPNRTALEEVQWK